MPRPVGYLARNKDAQGNPRWPSTGFLASLMHPESELTWAVLDRTQTTRDWRILPRRLPEHLVYAAVAGEASGEIQGVPIRLQAGMVLWIDPEVSHSFQNLPARPPLDLFHLRFRLRHARCDVVENPKPRIAENAGGVHMFCHMLRTEKWNPNSNCQEYQKAVLGAMLIQAGRLAEEVPGLKLNETQRRSVEALALKENYVLSSAALAREVRLNTDYFRRLFNATYRMSPRRWLVRRRLETAQVSLRESMLNISEIAEHLGYPDVFQFSRRFKSEFGLSPSVYRKTA